MPLTMPAATDLNIYEEPDSPDSTSQAAAILNGDVMPEVAAEAAIEPASEPQPLPKDDAGSQGENLPLLPSESEHPVASPAASPSGCSPDDFFADLCKLRDKKMQGGTALFAANRDVEELKEELKEAKAHVETLTASLLRMDGELFSLVAEQEKIFGAGSLFAVKRESEDVKHDFTSAPAPSPAETGAQPEGSQEENSTAPVADETWRDHPLRDLDISDAISKRLAEEGFSTVGDLSDLTVDGKHLTSIKGIGKGKAAQIEKALDGYWAMRIEAGKSGEPVASAPAETA